MTLRSRLMGTALAATLAVLAGCVTAAGAGEPFFRPSFGPVGEKHAPTLEAVWAQPQVTWGDLFRIYVRATDPDGDLDKVWVFFRRPGTSPEGTFLILPAAHRKTTNGYIEIWMWLIGTMHDTIFGAEATVTAEDRAGNTSASRTFTFDVSPFPGDGKKDLPAGFARDAKLGEMDLPQSMDLMVGDGDDRS